MAKQVGKEEVRNGVHFFCLQINIKVSCKFISTLWTSKFPTRWYYHYWWAWLSILKLLKVTSWQYLGQTSWQRRSQEWSSFFLPADKHQSFYKLALSFLMEVARCVQSTQNKTLVLFLQYLKKKVSQLLTCSIVMRNIQILYGGPVMFIFFKW